MEFVDHYFLLKLENQLNCSIYMFFGQKSFVRKRTLLDVLLRGSNAVILKLTYILRIDARYSDDEKMKIVWS